MFFEILSLLMLASFVIWVLMTTLAIKNESSSHAFKAIQDALFYFSLWPFFLIFGIIFMVVAQINEAKKRRRFDEWEP